MARFTTKRDHASRVVQWTVLIFVVIIGWLILPWFTPMYRWLHVDFAAIAAGAGVAEDYFANPRPVKVRHAPRGPDDPTPWQLIVYSSSETPPWEKNQDGSPVDEWQTLVRVHLISDRSGEPPGGLLLGAMRVDSDRYFECNGWRLPARSLERSDNRPVLLYEGGSFERIIPKLAKDQHSIVSRSDEKSGWINDDLWPERDDGWVPGETPVEVPSDTPSEETAPTQP